MPDTVQPQDTGNSTTKLITRIAERPVVLDVTNKPTVEAIDLSEIKVTANIDGDVISLIGVVPATEHAATLLDAAKLSFDESNIENNLFVAELPSKSDDPENSISKLANVLSNMSEDVLDAQLKLDNEYLSGQVNVSDNSAKLRLQALISDPSIAVTSSEAATIPATVKQTTVLQQEFDALKDLIAANIVFASGSDILPAKAYPVLDQLLESINIYTLPTVEIAGHTDSKADASYNMQLSARRAKSVKSYLLARGIDSTRIQAIGFGENQPIDTNKTVAGRANNRRVEFQAIQYRTN